jgi:hypothetical protein
MKMEDENCVTHKPQIWGNEKEQMEDLEVKIILILQL